MSFTQSRTTIPTGASAAIGPFRLRTRPLALSLLLLLTLQFLLGIVTNLYVPIPATHPGSGAANYFGGVLQGIGWALTNGEWSLQLHVLLGLGLLFTGFFFVWVAYATRERVWMISAPIVALGMLVASFSGASFLNYGDASSSLSMSVGFLIALVPLLIGVYNTPRISV